MPVLDDDAKLRWEDGVPVSERFDDPYYSRSDGLAETRHVFLDGNRLAERFRGAPTFQVAELGFGTGLNFLATLALWRARARPGAVLRYTSFERFLMTRDEMSQALDLWPELVPLREEMFAHVHGAPHFPDVQLQVTLGDARTELPRTILQADAWFLDGFAPARNPEMWEPALMEAVFRKTCPGGTFATYAAAGHVRRALQAAGFKVSRQPGFGTKREMLIGRRPEVAA